MSFKSIVQYGKTLSNLTSPVCTDARYFFLISEVLGWGGVNSLYVGYQLAKGYWQNNPYALENAEMATEATLYASAMTILIKGLFIANRPDGSGSDSFQVDTLHQVLHGHQS